jgi:ubiquitin-conjugating enzyme E2 W
VKRIRLLISNISLSIMASISARRLAKELNEIKSEGCPVGGCFRLISHEPARSLNYIHIYSCHYVGINLVEANDFSKWLFTIEVMGESLYQVRFHFILMIF